MYQKNIRMYQVKETVSGSDLNLQTFWDLSGSICIH